MRILLILATVVLSLVGAIFEDQVGKFDWRKELTGCPINVLFDRVQSGADKLVISTREEILASLSLNTGEIVWRRIFEKRNDTESASIATVADQDFVYSLVDGGRLLRVWRKEDGVMTWQKIIDERKATIGEIALVDGNVYVSTDQRIAAFSADGEQQFINEMFPVVTWARFAHSDGKLYHVSSSSSTQLTIRNVDKSASSVNVVSTFEVPRFNGNKCAVAGEYVACAHSEILIAVNVATSQVVEKNTGTLIREIIGSTSSSHFIVRGHTATKIFAGSDEVTSPSGISGEWNAATVVDASHALLASRSHVAVVSLKDGRALFESSTPISDTLVAPRRVFASRVSSSASQEWEVVLVGEDCRVQMVVVDGNKKKSHLEWSREESLMHISSVEMVDLPLSESQQMIEDEFEGAQGLILGAFVRRVVVQVGQLRKWLVRTLKQAFTFLSTLSTRANGLSDILNAVRSASTATSSEGPFERDYFNLRKVILLTTLDGVVFGVDSASGKTLWRMWLGNDFAPLSSQFGGEKVPLFVQRTTAHYQLDGQAAVAFRSSVNSNGIIVTFNPMKGTIVERKEIDSAIKKVSLLPFVNKEHIHSLAIVSKDSKVVYVPEVPQDVLASAAPLHFVEVDEKSTTLKGLKIDLPGRTLKSVWSGSLGLSQSDKIIAVKGKPYNQRVHSQGRVLIDREVQYKYVNPNLAAVASLDEKSQQLTIVLVDVVSGQVVHSAVVIKAAAPVHFVHSENWVAYTYWSEKGRRTELGIIELYEGEEEQSQTGVYNSHLASTKPPIVIAQSYIYAHGIESMSVTETEQGLTTRSILLALPCGSIHEVSRKLLDATRPLELTAEMREEMMIGYVPEIAVATEEMINYNQTVHRVVGIHTAPSGLESTSLVLAYGTDVFFTRLAPSGTFDILKDDFDHVLISTVLAALIIGTFVSKKLARSNALTAQWA